MLTPYDEFPIHQHSRPFSEIPVTDLSWDDGYFFGVYSTAHRVTLFTGLRVTPNNDVVGAYAGINLAGRQRTLRLSRRWRPDFGVGIGPLQYRFVEAFKEISLALAPNPSGLEFDIRWHALAPPYLEPHHVAYRHQRRTTDQTRYVQGGTAEGWIELDGDRFEVKRNEWWGDRDHSWGLYEAREPLSPEGRWVPPHDPTTRRAMRFWLLFQSPECSGFYQTHEDESGQAHDLNDVFGTGFQGFVDVGPPGRQERVELVALQHDLTFREGTRVLDTGKVILTDAAGGLWRQELKVVSPPWSPVTIGYDKGSWKDGGSIHTWHGDDEIVLEFDEFDFSRQPARHERYDGRVIPAMFGVEHLLSVVTVAPDGSSSDGAGKLEMFISKRHPRYGDRTSAT